MGATPRPPSGRRCSIRPRSCSYRLGSFCRPSSNLSAYGRSSSRFHSLVGWTLPQVALFYGTVNISFALADTISRGFDVFGPQFVKTGDFDRLLLRPRSTALQLMGHELRLTRIGRLLQGALVLGIAVGHARPVVGACARSRFLHAAIAGGVAFFLGLVVLQATLAFWTVESLEVANTLTYGGVCRGSISNRDLFQVVLGSSSPSLCRCLVSPTSTYRFGVLGHQRSPGRRLRGFSTTEHLPHRFCIPRHFSAPAGVSARRHYTSTGS